LGDNKLSWRIHIATNCVIVKKLLYFILKMLSFVVGPFDKRYFTTL
jgi:hypothetical protein